MAARLRPCEFLLTCLALVAISWCTSIAAASGRPATAPQAATTHVAAPSPVRVLIQVRSGDADRLGILAEAVSASVEKFVASHPTYLLSELEKVTVGSNAAGVVRLKDVADVDVEFGTVGQSPPSGPKN